MSALPDAVLQNPASFLDDRTAPCQAPCNNSWHDDHKISQRIGYDCETCKLPANHGSMHWTGCQPKQLT